MASYGSSEKTHRLCFFTTSAIARTSASLITAPVGLQGELTIIAFVFGVMHFSMSAAVMLKPFSS